MILNTPISLILADGKQARNTIYKQTLPLQLNINGHIETFSLFVVSNLCHGILLGMSWLKIHNPSIDWLRRKVRFDSLKSLNQCVTGALTVDAVETPEVATSTLATVAAIPVKRAKRLKKKKSVSFSSTIDDVAPGV
jgi:hypothetical protein